MAYNYSKFVKEITIDDIDQYHCECQHNNFKDNFHNRIVTGNLNVLEDRELIEIFQFGSKF